jgi:putative membrane protein
MALSEQEQKRLDQLEASLLADDPKFADTLRGTPQFRVQRRRAALAGVVFVAGLTALVLGVQFQPVISIIGFVMMLASAITGISAWSRVAAQEEPTRSSSKSSHPSSGTDFMNKLEERWRKRQQGGDL